MRFCECGCTECWKQTAEHPACSLECKTEVVETVPRHGREIIVITQQ